MIAKTTQIDVPIPIEVRRFADEHNLLGYVQAAIQAVREVYADAERIVVSMKRDPEFDTPLIDINAVIPDEDPEVAAERHWDCLSKWTKGIPPEVDNIRVSTTWISR
jgi:hypothetical protein